MNKNNKVLIGAVVIGAVLIVLFAWPKINNPNRPRVNTWHDIGVDCLPSHQNASLHIHPQLSVIVDGKPETIPANVGIVKDCMAEVHTHDANNIIHIESVLAEKTFTLSQFMSIYEKPIERPGYTLQMTVDEVPSAELGNLVMKDKLLIVLTYTPTTPTQ